MINYQRLRRAKQLARRAQVQRNSKKWDAANRIIARAIGKEIIGWKHFLH
ncbi:hypothetical protein BN1221_04442 [Brenneria goodwinii]|uniref:Uncharacterized protein n=1 Tax=Brenneria goodwinii TaxID=1109412 RepID=A0A0G4K1U4_9GAMM|nr:hypothetical protein BN1221_04442 [Brenneria goodwinii]